MMRAEPRSASARRMAFAACSAAAFPKDTLSSKTLSSMVADLPAFYLPKRAIIAKRMTIACVE
jgi:hypothetical protein